jgi:hypothetical protein
VFGSTLRVTNVGSTDVHDLVVLFPEERMAFDNVPAGATTPYRESSRGVFRYAAYQFRVGDLVYTQPVIDWVGEQPMAGKAFTYSIELFDSPPSRPQIRLVTTTQDR